MPLMDMVSEWRAKIEASWPMIANLPKPLVRMHQSKALLIQPPGHVNGMGTSTGQYTKVKTI